jgi:hypothetical protein
MACDPIVDEVRQFRDADVQRLHYDLEAICRDIRTKQAQGGRKVVSLPPIICPLNGIIAIIEGGHYEHQNTRYD